MGKRFRKGGKAASTSGGDGGLSDQELKALADKTSFSLENVTDFHEVKDLAQLLLYLLQKIGFFFMHLQSCHINVKILHAQCFMNDCPDGRMSKEKMKEMFATTVAKSKVSNFCQKFAEICIK